MIVSRDKITSRQNRLVIEAGKLCDRKGRNAAGCFRFDGVKLFAEAVEKGVAVRRILLAESRADRMLDIIGKYENSESLSEACAYILSDEVFAKVSEEQSPEGIITIAVFPNSHAVGDRGLSLLEESARGGKRILLLESVRDPGNVGTILRSAAAFGVDCVAISSDCADIYNSKTIRGAMGALFRMKIAVFSDITEAVRLLRSRGRCVYAAALDPTALRLGPSVLGKADCVLIGNEGHGLSDAAIRACDRSLYIPMEEGSESLNAAIAASIILWSMYGG